MTSVPGATSRSRGTRRCGSAFLASSWRPSEHDIRPNGRRIIPVDRCPSKHAQFNSRLVEANWEAARPPAMVDGLPPGHRGHLSLTDVPRVPGAQACNPLRAQRRADRARSAMEFAINHAALPARRAARAPQDGHHIH